MNRENNYGTCYNLCDKLSNGDKQKFVLFENLYKITKNELIKNNFKIRNRSESKTIKLKPINLSFNVYQSYNFSRNRSVEHSSNTNSNNNQNSHSLSITSTIKSTTRSIAAKVKSNLKMKNKPPTYLLKK